MRSTFGRVRRSVIFLVLFLLAGCGIQPTPTPSQLQPELPFALQPQAVHIQRKVYVWDSGNGFQAPPAVNVTRTDSTRVTRFFAHIRTLPTFTLPPVISCSAEHYSAFTLISFLDGPNVLMQVMVQNVGCVFTRIVGYPPDVALYPDAAFGYELNDLIANPA